MELKEDKKAKPTVRKKHSFWKVLLLNLVLMGVVVIVLLWCLSGYLASYTHHDERVEVPDLSGIIGEEAESYLETLGLSGMVIDSVYSDARPGTVIEQNPVAGLPVKKGRVVYLTINAKSVRMVKLADVREWSSRQAQSKLSELGFVIDSIRQVPCEFDDLVLGVNASGGNELIPGREYPYRTHVVVRVGSTHVAMVAENDSTESAWLE